MLPQPLKTAVIGKKKNPFDRSIFHRLSLAAFFAWVGLGADGLSSSCYGPEQAFLALKGFEHLSLFVAIGAVVTVLVISASYSQIIELFPEGGGGYFVAGRLLSPAAGMVSGSALLIDYVLTISISIASGADALFSFFPPGWQADRLAFAVLMVFILILMNIRGVKETVAPLTPIFLLFIATHFFIILYALTAHASALPAMAGETARQTHAAAAQLGGLGALVFVMRAFSMGAGTYTGLEAVSNGLPILREPKVRTGKKTMLYMALSLAFTASGLLAAYLLFKVEPVQGKTLNAVLFEKVMGGRRFGGVFVPAALVSEALLLFVAAQTGFLDGPRVLANMAVDRWFPAKFSQLNDRLVTQNGILLIGGAALATMLLTRGQVSVLVVLYSINVFITFCLSQTGMVRHWWQKRSEAGAWKRKLVVNSLGLLISAAILVTVIFMKFFEGGWITLVLTAALIALAYFIRQSYTDVARRLHALNRLIPPAAPETKPPAAPPKRAPIDERARTAVIFVNGFNGLGLYTFFRVMQLFDDMFKNVVFVEVGLIDAGNFKDEEKVRAVGRDAKKEIRRYVAIAENQDRYAEAHCPVDVNMAEEVGKVSEELLKRFPKAVFFGGRLMFERETFWTRHLHNDALIAMQKTFYGRGIPFMVIPVRLAELDETLASFERKKKSGRGGAHHERRQPAHAAKRH